MTTGQDRERGDPGDVGPLSTTTRSPPGRRLVSGVLVREIGVTRRGKRVLGRRPPVPATPRLARGPSGVHWSNRLRSRAGQHWPEGGRSRRGRGGSGDELRGRAGPVGPAVRGRQFRRGLSTFGPCTGRIISAPRRAAPGVPCRAAGWGWSVGPPTGWPDRYRRANAANLPPATRPGRAPPSRWGTEQHCRGLFGARVVTLTADGAPATSSVPRHPGRRPRCSAIICAVNAIYQNPGPGRTADGAGAVVGCFESSTSPPDGTLVGVSDTGNDHDRAG